MPPSADITASTISHGTQTHEVTAAIKQRNLF